MGKKIFLKREGTFFFPILLIFKEKKIFKGRKKITAYRWKRTTQNVT